MALNPDAPLEDGGLNLTEETQDTRLIYRWSFWLRFSAGFVAWLVTAYMDLPLMEDAMTYEDIAAHVAQDWDSNRPSQWMERAMNDQQGQAWGMVGAIAVLHYLTGGLRVMPLLIAVFCSVTAWTPVLTYRIARRLGAPARAARFSAWLIVFSPCFAFWSGALYKEGLILLLLNLGIYHLLLLQEQWRWQSLLLVGASIMALFGLRFYLAVLMGGTIAFSLLLGRSKGQQGEDGTRVVLFRQVGLVAGLVLVLVALGFTDFIQSFLPADLNEGLALMENSRRDLAKSNSGYLSNVKVETASDSARFLPLGLAYFLTVPLPWQWGAIRQNLAIPETAFWLFLYPLIFVGVKQAYRRHAQGTLAILLITVSISCFYALFIGNIGTAFRLRIQVWLLWAVFAGLGWEARRQDRDEAPDFDAEGATVS